MWPATAWIVTGDVTGAIARRRRLRDGPGGVLPAEEQQPRRHERRVVPEALRLVEDRRGAIAERRLLAGPAGELDRGGEEHGVDGLERRVLPGAVVSTARERSGRDPFRRL